MLRIPNTYFKPSKKLRALAVLEAVAGDHSLPQTEVANRTDMSNAMVNHYLRELRDQDLIHFIPVNGRNYNYQLTTPGETYRREHFGQYCAEVVQAYAALKGMVRDKLMPLQERGLLRLALYGASETCEIALSSLQDTPFHILALVDNDPTKQGHMLRGYVIQPPSALDSLNHQAIVVTSFGRQEEIYQQLMKSMPPNTQEIVRL